MIAASPKLLLQCDLAEYIHCSEAACNLQNRDDFAEGKACAVGSMSKWGADTCVPDVKSVQGQAFLESWGGRAYHDGGCRAYYWGEARMMGGGKTETVIGVSINMNMCVCVCVRVSVLLIGNAVDNLPQRYSVPRHLIQVKFWTTSCHAPSKVFLGHGAYRTKVLLGLQR